MVTMIKIGDLVRIKVDGYYYDTIWVVVEILSHLSFTENSIRCIRGSMTYGRLFKLGELIPEPSIPKFEDGELVLVKHRGEQSIFKKDGCVGVVTNSNRLGSMVRTYVLGWEHEVEYFSNSNLRKVKKCK